jgi:hypothetical protein
MEDIFKHIFIIFSILGFIMIVTALWRFKKTFEEHRKCSNDDILSESEKIIQNKTIKILIIGVIFICISIIAQFILFFL